MRKGMDALFVLGLSVATVATACGGGGSRAERATAPAVTPNSVPASVNPGSVDEAPIVSLGPVKTIPPTHEMTPAGPDESTNYQQMGSVVFHVGNKTEKYPIAVVGSPYVTKTTNEAFSTIVIGDTDHSTGTPTTPFGFDCDFTAPSSSRPAGAKRLPVIVGLKGATPQGLVVETGVTSRDTLLASGIVPAVGAIPNNPDGGQNSRLEIQGGDFVFAIDSKYPNPADVTVGRTVNDVATSIAGFAKVVDVAKKYCDTRPQV